MKRRLLDLLAALSFSRGLTERCPECGAAPGAATGA
jgi:hypothetical protein